MSIPGYPAVPASLAFSDAEHGDFVLGSSDPDWSRDLTASTNADIDRWTRAASASLHKRLHDVVQASQQQLDILAKLLADAGVDVDSTTWTADLTDWEADFAWASAAQGCVLALLDLVVDWPEATIDDHLVAKYAAAKVDSARFTRATGLASNHHEYAISLTWDAIARSLAGTEVLYRDRFVRLRRKGDALAVDHVLEPTSKRHRRRSRR
jgi:hypothetical protein